MENNKILVIDERGFARICSAILECSGYGAETLTDGADLSPKVDGGEFGLIVTSYPYGRSLFDEIKKRRIPTIILTHNIDRNLINTLDGFDNAYCMIKPLDYAKFRSIIKKVMESDMDAMRGYSIV